MDASFHDLSLQFQNFIFQRIGLSFITVIVKAKLSLLPDPQKLLPDFKVFLGLELLKLRLVEEDEEFVAVADAEVDVDRRRVVEHHRRQRQNAPVSEKKEHEQFLAQDDLEKAINGGL